MMRCHKKCENSVNRKLKFVGVDLLLPSGQRGSCYRRQPIRHVQLGHARFIAPTRSKA
ncbi:unnamed protein product [Hapterophycus canaliculatus]